MLSPGYPLKFGSPPIMRGRVRREGSTVNVDLVGEFDIASAPAFTTALKEIEATNPDGIVVNVQELGFLDSSGIRALVDAHRRAGGARSFAVLNGSGHAHRVLELVGLDNLLVVEDAAEETPL
jgi:anti-sigma B factor antagonist